jgi:hypothetical protein
MTGWMGETRISLLPHHGVMTMLEEAPKPKKKKTESERCGWFILLGGLLVYSWSVLF